MTTSLEESLPWGSLDPLPPVQGPSPYELDVDPLAVDGRRPWPLGVPTGREVLEAIVDRGHVARALKPAHLEVLRVLPEALLDSVATCLAGTEDPMGSVTISAWRAMVAAAGAQRALGVDQPALRALIAEAAAAREKVQALGYFSLDGGASAEPLLHALGEAIELLVKRARFVATPRVRGKRTSASGRLVPVPRARRVLQVVTAAVVLVAAAFHASAALEQYRARGSWVVVGDVDRGRAFLAPGGTEPDEAALRALIEGLEQQGIGATQSASGEWVLHRIGKGSP